MLEIRVHPTPATTQTARRLQDSAEATDDSRFYALLVEVLKIEVNVLLNDLLRPAADASTTPTAKAGNSASDGTAATTNGAGPSASSAASLPAREVTTDMDVDVAGPSQPAEAGKDDDRLVEHVPPQQPSQLWTPEQQAELWAAAERAAAAAAGSGAATQQAAERVLPAVFSLLEAAVEVLAADAERTASTSVDESAPRLSARCAPSRPVKP